jgi:ubiquinone/menaquinone biosynthesis C-methylase UbiE
LFFSFSSSRDVSKYGDDAFWKSRYEKGGASSFEWFVSFQELVDQVPVFKSILDSRVKMNAKVLEIGCGTSEVCENLWDMGFRDVTGLDNQQNAIDFCLARQGEQRQINYIVGDMTNLPFADGEVDVVVDKGALDSFVCKGGDGELFRKTAVELYRVLKAKETSVLIVISNAPLTEIVDGLKNWFELGEKWMVKNESVGQLMAKAYLFMRRKKPITK